MQSPKKNDKGNLLKATPTVGLKITNRAVSTEPATIYSGVIASLQVTLGNLTGNDVVVSNGASLQIFMPGYFSTAEVRAMDITNFSADGWKFSYPAPDALLMIYSGADVKWTSGTTITFSIEKVTCAQRTGVDTVQINLSGLQGTNIPAQISSALLLSAAPVPSHIDLKDVLLVNTEFGGQIYVSTEIDPLTNKLYLDLKNTGPTPLYNGSTKWSGNPRVTVSFVYGNTSGSLAPDNKQKATQRGSAWGIGAAVSVDQTGGWSVHNPSVTDAGNSPAWIMSPVNTNKQIIGINDQSNVSFVFSNIFSFTPTGPTQLYVQFTGFSQSEQNTYNDCVFVVPILKGERPPYRGILNFYGPPVFFIKQMEDVPVHLQWSAFQTASVSLVSNAAPLPIPSPYKKSYPDPTTLLYDNTTVVLPDVEPDTSVVFTLDAYDGGRAQLNSKQFLVTVEQKPGIYLFSGPDKAVDYTMNKPANVQLNWKVYSVAMIEIYAGDKKLTPKSYKPSPLWNTESVTLPVEVSGINPSQQFTLKSYDREGVLVETMSCTVNCIATKWCDPKDGTIYPLVRINNQVWLGSNYAYNDPKGSLVYNNDPKNEKTYGRLYSFAAAERNVPDGWRLPVNSDWNQLKKIFGAELYKPLLVGGATGLNFLLGGAHYSPSPGGFFDNMNSFGAYWGKGTEYPGIAANVCMLFYQAQKATTGEFPSTFCPDGCFDSGSVRYIFRAMAVELHQKEQEQEESPPINPDEFREFLSPGKSE